MKEKKRVAVIGGGSGASAILPGFVDREDVDISVIVSMADDGGSTGILRRELEILPPGDARLCMLALSPDSPLKRAMTHRFSEGFLTGHNAGNILLAALTQTHTFEEAIQACAELLQAKGQVIPVTLDHVNLAVEHGGQVTVGEHVLDGTVLQTPRKVSLQPIPKTNPRAVDAILAADVVLIGPGSLYTSILATIVSDGIPEALGKTDASLVYNCNLLTVPNHTHNFSVMDFLREVESYLERPIDLVTYHNQPIPKEILAQAVDPKAAQVALGSPSEKDLSRIVGADVLSKDVGEQTRGDLLKRTQIKHNPDALARLIFQHTK